MHRKWSKSSKKSFGKSGPTVKFANGFADEILMSMKVWAIIPARGGSKRLPKKNVLPLNGKPLIAHTIEFARSLGVFSRVIVSTDCPEIASIASLYGAEIPFLRSTLLATDKADLTDVIWDLLDTLSAQGQEPDAYVVMYPTHPVRTPEVGIRVVEALRTCLGVWSVFRFVLRPVPLRSNGTSLSVPCKGEVILSMPSGHMYGYRYIPKSQRQVYSPEHFDQFLKQRHPGVRNSGYCVPVEYPGAWIDINTESDLRVAEEFLLHKNEISDGQLAPRSYRSLPLSCILLGHDQPRIMNAAPVMETDLPDCGGRPPNIGMLTFRNRQMVPISEACYLRIHGDTVSPLFPQNPLPVTGSISGRRIVLECDPPEGAEMAAVDFGINDLDTLEGTLQRFSLHPFWKYDPATAVLTNLFTGGKITGEQDCPKLEVHDVDRVRQLELSAASRE